MTSWTRPLCILIKGRQGKTLKGVNFQHSRLLVTPFDWYNARIALDFKVQQRDGTNFVVGEHVDDNEILVADIADITAYELTKWEL